MAGPAACVLVAFAGQRYVPNWWDVLSPYASGWHEPDFCFVSDSKRFGGSYVGDGRPFVGRVMELERSDFSPAEADAVAAVTGREFTHVIEIGAMCNDPADQRILCELCIAVAEQLKGLVDFGVIEAPFAELGLQRCSWMEEEGEYWTALGSPDAGRRWLAHEAFYMVK